jgi:hypothetical protein
MIQTLAFNARLPVLLGASPFYRTPNSPIARGLELNETDFVKARLTALAIETDYFFRDDIYTLFVTTRIVNFLKGLSLAGDPTLEDLLSGSFAEPRTRVGFEILCLLLRTGRLYFATRSGLVENRHFRTALFHRVMASAAIIGCQNGRTIDVAETFRDPSTHSESSAENLVTAEQ